MGPLYASQNVSGVAPRGGPRRLASESRSYADPEDPSGREPLHVPYRARAEHGGAPVVRILVDEERCEVGEPTPVVREELRMVERVVQECGELEAEALAGHDVLVEGKVHDPRSRSLQAALLGVAVLSGGGERVGGLIEELVARAPRVGIADLVRTPAVREAVADAVEREADVPRARGVEAAEERG